MTSYKLPSLLILILLFSCSYRCKVDGKSGVFSVFDAAVKSPGREFISSIDLSTLLSISLSLRTHICDAP